MFTYGIAMLDSKFPIYKALDLFMLLSLEASDTETVIQHLCLNE